MCPHDQHHLSRPIEMLTKREFTEQELTKRELTKWEIDEMS